VNEVRLTLQGQRKPHYTVEEVAELSGRTPYTVRRWIAEKRIAASRISGTGPRGRLLIAREELDTLIRSGLGTDIPDAVANSDRSTPSNVNVQGRPGQVADATSVNKRS
jgi:excisionase family DNA binding protein